MDKEKHKKEKPKFGSNISGILKEAEFHGEIRNVKKPNLVVAENKRERAYRISLLRACKQECYWNKFVYIMYKKFYKRPMLLTPNMISTLENIINEERAKEDKPPL